VRDLWIEIHSLLEFDEPPTPLWAAKLCQLFMCCAWCVVLFESLSPKHLLREPRLIG